MNPIRIAHLYQDIQANREDRQVQRDAVVRSRKVVDHALTDGQAHYGINTGFGVLANKRIDNDQVFALQRNLLVSHACGVGVPLRQDITRLMIELKIHALAQGFSGVSLSTFNQLHSLLEHEITPVVPSRGSVGASGDLAPLAHLCLPLIGEGKVWQGDRQVPARAVLDQHQLAPIELQAKDGLALINGTQFMSAIGAWVLERCGRLQRSADILAAMSVEALQGSIKPFDPRLHQVRPHPGQIDVAKNICALLQGSEILHSHRNCGKVQDPYCLRCVPQVHGASRSALQHAIDVVETEINSVTDNPIVFASEDGTGDIISGGNFHGQPLALVLDYTAMALAELASISERRTYLLLGGHDGLPTLLMQDTGVNSGFMIPQYTAAALVSENKVLCHPAGVDTIPTSLGQEDHVSMGSISAMKLLQVLENVEYVLGIELFCAAQALDYRAPLAPGRGVALAHSRCRSEVSHVEADYAASEDLAVCRELVAAGTILNSVEAKLGALQ